MSRNRTALVAVLGFLCLFVGMGSTAAEYEAMVAIEPGGVQQAAMVAIEPGGVQLAAMVAIEPGGVQLV